MRTEEGAVTARAYQRYTPATPPTTSEQARGGGGASGPVLRTDEVSRHAVRVVVVRRDREDVEVTSFARVPELLRAGDLVVVNDAATLPASLHGRTSRGECFELRLSAPVDGNRLHGVLFGDGDHRTPTEDRPSPAALAAGEQIELGGVHADVIAVAGRRVELMIRATGDALWHTLYANGRPVQYAHRPEPLPLWAVQTAYAGRPWAAEMPSAGRPLTWDVLLGLRRAGVSIARLTHAAGLSSTGDDALDRVLPWPERYEIPRRTVEEIGRAKASGRRVIAVGTTVVRALEACALANDGALVAGSGIASVRLDPAYELRVVDGIVSGLHVPGESHFELLGAFAPCEQLVRALELAAGLGLSGHELGDACMIL